MQFLLRNRLFLAILVLKLASAMLFASGYPLQYFIPFVKGFLLQPFADPYGAFVASGFSDAFPYPPFMLFMLAIPMVLTKFISSVHIDLLLLRLPLLLADILIALIFCHLLKGRERDVVWYYWASPVLFYISYIHGQLDVIPIMLLLLSVALLFWRNRWATFASFVAFGAGVASKTSVLLALPFLLMYVWKQTRSYITLALCSIISGGVFAFFALPFLTEGFVQMVFLSEQQARLFAFTLPLYSGLVLFVAPIAYLALFFRFAGYKRITPDALMMILSLVFAIFMTLVPPRPGWFFWGMPFIIYFFIRFDSLRRFTYWALNAAYFLFFWTWVDGDFPQFLAPLIPQAAYWPNAYAWLAQRGIPADFVSSAMFSILVAMIIVVAYWIYRYGIRRNDELYIRNKPFCIGVGGDSGTGKTTISELLADTLGRSNVTIINGDDMHRWERGDENWQRVTHLNPQGNRLHLDYQQALQLVNGRPIYRRSYDHNTGKFTEPLKLDPTRFVVFSGLHPFYLKGMRQMQDLKIFLDPDEQLRQEWKIARDKKERGHSRQAVLAAMKKRKPDTDKYIRPQRDFADIVISFTANPVFTLHMRLDNSIDAEQVQRAFAPAKGLKLEHRYDEDCEHQTFAFSGNASQTAIRAACMALVPDYDLVLQHEPRWQPDLNGVVQALIVYQLFMQMRGENRDL